MAEENKKQKNDNFFTNLKKFLSSSIVVKYTDDTEKIKVFDINNLQTIKNVETNRLIDKYFSLYKSGYNMLGDVSTTGFSTMRSDLYRNYEIMDQDPIISAVLDLLSEEGSMRNEYGEVIAVNSDKEYIQKTLENLLYDVLNIEFNLPWWIRNLAKYGDFFMKLDIVETVGITNCIPLSVYGVERLEDFNNPALVKFSYDDALATNLVTYSNILSSVKKQTFEQYEIAHFRLLADSNYLPYGRSYLEGARKVWNQLTLMIDSMMLQRIMRAPERRIFKIDVGNLAPDQVPAHMQKIITKLKKTPYIDERTGNYDLKFALMPVAWYTKIPLLDGRIITIKDLYDEIKLGKKNYVYSVDRNNGNKIVSGEVIDCVLNKKNADLVRITLDDDSYIDFEPSHPVMLRTGDYKAAKDLIEGESLMSFYSQENERSELKNHKVKFVEFLKERADVYCMEVKDFHNFAIDSHNGTLRNGIFVKNSSLEDFYLPVRGDKSGTDITTLPGMAPPPVTDLEFLEQRLYTALKIPKAFLANEADVNSRATVAAQDLRMARTIDRFHKIIVSELTKICVVHLYTQGYRDEDLIDFELEMFSPSTVYQLEKIELLDKYADLAEKLKNLKLHSDKWIYNNIFNMSDTEAAKEEEGIIFDIKKNWRHEQIEQGSDPAIDHKISASDFGDEESSISDMVGKEGEIPEKSGEEATERTPTEEVENTETKGKNPNSIQIPGSSVEKAIEDQKNEEDEKEEDEKEEDAAIEKARLERNRFYKQNEKKTKSVTMIGRKIAEKNKYSPNNPMIPAHNPLRVDYSKILSRENTSKNRKVLGEYNDSQTFMDENNLQEY